MMMILMGGLFAQETVPSVRIIDISDETTMVQSPSSSSSTSCNSSDFPVLRHGITEAVNFNDVSWITVRHDITPSNSDIYVTVELTSKSDEVRQVEMAKNMRISGKTEEGNFAIQVKKISTLQVLHKPS